MKTMGKVLAFASLAAVFVMAFYTTHQAAKIQEQRSEFQRRAAFLTEHLKQLQHERDEATNALSLARDQVASLNSQQNTLELLKLRGEVGQLRGQLAVIEGKGGALSGGLAQMMSDPAMKSSMRQNCLLRTQIAFSDLFKELKLTPEQSQKASQLISDSMMNAAEKLYALPQGTMNPDELSQLADGWIKDVAKELVPLLGDKGAARFTQYYEDIPAHAAVELLKGRLGGDQLSDDQNNRLLQIIKAEPFGLTSGIAGIWEKDFWGSQAAVDNHLEQVAQSNQHIVDQASSFLTADQVDNLNAVLSNSVSARMAQAAAYIKKP
jgi:hypothetical protein